MPTTSWPGFLLHIPTPRRRLVRYYGHSANAARAKRRREAGEGRSTKGLELGLDESLPAAAESKRLRRGWAQLIRRIFEVDHLFCQCGETMRILSFLSDPPVVRRILQHLEGKSSVRPRGPPQVGAELPARAS